MPSLNKLTIIGNVGTDPEMRFTPNGNAVTSFSVATNRRYKDTDETTWFKVVAWGKLAETCNQYVSKGMSVYVEGSVTLRQWGDNNSKAGLEVNAQQVIFLSRKNTTEVAHTDELEPEELPF